MADPILNGKQIQEFQTRFGSPPGSGNLETERQQWEQLCQELLAERDGLCEDNARLQRERDKFYRSLLAHLPPAPPEYDISLEEIKALRDQGPSLEEFIRELEQTYGG